MITALLTAYPVQRCSNCFICIIHSIGPTRPLSLHILFFIFTYMRKLRPEWWEMPNHTVSKGQSQEWTKSNDLWVHAFNNCVTGLVTGQHLAKCSLNHQEFNNCLGASERMDTRRRTEELLAWFLTLLSHFAQESAVCSYCQALNLNLDWWEGVIQEFAKQTEPLRVLAPLHSPWGPAVGNGLFSPCAPRGILNRSRQEARTETEPQTDKQQERHSPVLSVGSWMLSLASLERCHLPSFSGRLVSWSEIWGKN